MKKVTCIACPNSCVLSLNSTGQVIGNKCKRGVEFFANETTSPTRMLCTTVKTVFSQMPVLSVRTVQEIPKNLIFDIVKLLSCVTLEKKLHRGDVVVKNILDTGVDVVATSDMFLRIDQNM